MLEIFYTFTDYSSKQIEKARVLDIEVSRGGVLVTLEDPRYRYSDCAEGEGPDLVAAIREAGKLLEERGREPDLATAIREAGKLLEERKGSW